MEFNNNNLKDFILNVRTPYVLKGLKLPWKCFSQSLEEFCKKLDDNQAIPVAFESATLQHGHFPQWENCRQTLNMTFAEFWFKFKENTEEQNWATCSYKSIEEYPNCFEDVTFARFGFEHLNDISYWLGSKGAHTSCHYDTYGCNIVVQVYGRKSWILLPNNSKLHPTRVPYEESSVYCEENFYSPSNFEQFKDIENNVHHVILEPGDCLIVPPKWWHYVENLDMALSINTWIPLDIDENVQIEECIVKTQIQQLTKNLDGNLKSLLINPNELTQLYDTNLQDNLKLLNSLVDFVKSSQNKQVKRLKLNNTHSTNYLASFELDNLLIKYQEHWTRVNRITKEEFHNILALNSKRFNSNIKLIENEEIMKEYLSVSSFINATCHPKVTEIMRNKFLNG